MLKKEIVEVINISRSMREAGRRLGMRHLKLKNLCLENNIDFSHFTHGNTDDALIGQKFNKLTVESIEKIPYRSKEKRKRHRTFAICICDCGKRKRLRCDALKSGKTSSCGCVSANRWNMVGNLNPAFAGSGMIGKCFLSDIKYSAKKRDLEFAIDIFYLSDLYEKQNRKCALTGLPISFGRTRQCTETTASLDRIDSDLGYIKGNVQWVLKDVNMLKNHYSTDKFISLCKAVAAYNN